MKNAHWFCNPCDDPAMSLIAAERSMKEACEIYMEEVTQRLENCERIATTKADVNTVANLSKRVEELTAQINTKKISPAEDDKATENVTSIQAVKEIEERERRSKNVMLFNLPESTAESTEEAGRDEQMKLEEIGKALSTGIETMKMVRIGKKEMGKTRPLKITLQDRGSRDALLSKAKHLRNSTEEMTKNLVIKRDLTQHQRQEEKNLLMERNKLRDEDRENGVTTHTWIIRSGKIIKFKINPPNQATPKTAKTD